MKELDWVNHLTSNVRVHIAHYADDIEDYKQIANK